MHAKPYVAQQQQQQQVATSLVIQQGQDDVQSDHLTGELCNLIRPIFCS